MNTFWGVMASILSLFGPGSYLECFIKFKESYWKFPAQPSACLCEPHCPRRWLWGWCRKCWYCGDLLNNGCDKTDPAVATILLPAEKPETLHCTAILLPSVKPETLHCTAILLPSVKPETLHCAAILLPSEKPETLLCSVVHISVAYCTAVP